MHQTTMDHNRKAKQWQTIYMAIFPFIMGYKISFAFTHAVSKASERKKAHVALFSST